MKLWIGAEMDHSVGDDFRVIRNRVEAFINNEISIIEADMANDWDVIAILRDDEHFPEIVKFKKSDMDIRLSIPLEDFRNSDLAGKISLLISMLRRSLGHISKKYPDLACINHVQDILTKAEKNA